WWRACAAPRPVWTWPGRAGPRARRPPRSNRSGLRRPVRREPRSVSRRGGGRRSCRLQVSDDATTDTGERSLPGRRIVDHLRLVEGRTEHGGVGNLATQPAADTALVHVRHGIIAKWVAAELEGERGAAVQAHTGLVARAHVGVDAEAGRLHARSRLEAGGGLGLDAALALELALAAADDDLEPPGLRAHGLAHRGESVGHLVGIDHAEPGDAEAPDGVGDGHADMVAARVLARGGIRLLAGGRGVEVLQDDEDRILLVVDGIGHTGGQSRMPESAVAENGDHALAEARR